MYSRAFADALDNSSYADDFQPSPPDQQPSLSFVPWDQWTGDVASTSVATGDLSTAIQLAGATTGTATVAGALTTIVKLGGADTGAASETGALSTAIQLGGAGSGAGVDAGDLATGILLGGTEASSGAASGDLSTSIRLGGDDTGAATANGDLSTVITMAGDGTGTATDTGDLSTEIPLDGTDSGAAALTGGLTTVIKLRGAGSGTVIAHGSVTTGIDLAGAVIVRATPTGNLRLGDAVIFDGRALVMPFINGRLIMPSTVTSGTRARVEMQYTNSETGAPANPPEVALALYMRQTGGMPTTFHYNYGDDFLVRDSPGRYRLRNGIATNGFFGSIIVQWISGGGENSESVIEDIITVNRSRVV